MRLTLGLGLHYDFGRGRGVRTAELSLGHGDPPEGVIDVVAEPVVAEAASKPFEYSARHAIFLLTYDRGGVPLPFMPAGPRVDHFV